MLKTLFLTAMMLVCMQVVTKADDIRAETVATDLVFPEGTIFVGDVLYFVDYARSSVMKIVDHKTAVVWHQNGCGANGLLFASGGLLVACFDSGSIIGITMDGATVNTVTQDDRGNAFSAPNDLAIDRKGGVYFTASGSFARPGKVFHMGTDRVVREVASGIAFANGIGLSPDGATLYVAETSTGRILAFVIKPDGSLGPSRELIRLRDVVTAKTHGAIKPDSLRVDADGNLFVALYEGGGLAIISPAGALVRLLDVPSAHHTNLAISPNGKSLYVAAVDDDSRSTYRGRIVRMHNPLAP